MVNLVDLLKNQLTSEVIEKASGFLGENTANTSSALSGIIPTLLSGVIGKGSNMSGASSLLNMLNSGGHDGGILNNLGGLFAGGNTSNNLIQSGGGILSSLFGNKVGSIVDMITSFSGMKRGSSSSLLSMAAPLVMGLLGKQVKSGGLNASGLMNLLQGQREHVNSAMPAGLGSMFGKFGLDQISNNLSSGVKETVGTATRTATRTVERTTEKVNEGGGFKLWPLLLLLGALALGFFGWKQCSSDIKDGASAVTDTVTDAATATTDAIGDAANATVDAAKGAVDAVVSSVSLPGGVSLNLPKGSLVDKFATFLGSGSDDISSAFSFDRLNFETGSDKLTADSQEQLSNLAAVLKAYPNVEVKLVGNTDNTGNEDANKKLSLSRAQSVKADLIGKGIAASRMKTEGVGSANPIATNDTDEGKAKNRRIDLQITKK